MVAFPKIGYCFKLRSDHCFKLGSDVGTDTFVSHRMVVSRIIESGERLTKEQIGRFYNLYHDDVTDNTFKRLAVFVRPRVLFWDFTNGLYRIYPWDEQTAKRIWERLVPIGQTDPTTIPTVEVDPKDKDKYHKAAETYEVRKNQLKVGELWMMDGGSSTGVSLDPISENKTEKPKPPYANYVCWSEHAKVVTELAALKATLKRHFPSLKFD